MATFKVKTKVSIPACDFEVETEVEADSEFEAHHAAEEEITEEMMLEKIKESNVIADADFDSSSETDAVACESCDALYAPNELNEDGECEDCAGDEEEEDDDA